MWWVPQTESESIISNHISRIARVIREDSKVGRVIHAVGSTGGESGEVRLLLVLDQSLAPRRPRESLIELMREEFGFRVAEPSPRRQKANLLISLENADADIRLFLSQFRPPGDTQIMFSVPPPPLVGQRPKRIRGANKRRATLGFGLRIGAPDAESRYALTTAGHFVATEPCNVSVRRLRWPGILQEERIGSISNYSDPANGPGVDIAIVEIATSPIRFRFGAAYRLADAPTVADRASAHLYGAVSGVQRGWINGALQLTRTADGRFWKNCWSVMEIEGGFAQRGDSGGRVELDDGRVLGHLVAALGVQRSTRRYQCGLVQDVSTIHGFLKGVMMKTEPVFLVEWQDMAPPQGLLSRWVDGLFD